MRWCKFARVTATNQREYDQVIVGAGTAGCIVAARLAEKGQRVLLLEAGGPYRRILDVPLVGLWKWLRNPAGYCWNEYTVPQAIAWRTSRLVSHVAA